MDDELRWWLKCRWHEILDDLDGWHRWRNPTVITSPRHNIITLDDNCMGRRVRRELGLTEDYTALIFNPQSEKNIYLFTAWQRLQADYRSPQDFHTVDFPASVVLPIISRTTFRRWRYHSILIDARIDKNKLL